MTYDVTEYRAARGRLNAALARLDSVWEAGEQGSIEGDKALMEVNEAFQTIGDLDPTNRALREARKARKSPRDRS